MANFPIAAGLEILKLMLQAVVQFTRATGMSKEELEEAFKAELAVFDQNDPADLPDV
jgi:hypothetical protein